MQLGVQRDTLYPQSELERDLSQQLGATVRTHCEHSLLTELWMCVSKDLQVIDCPANIAARCSSIQLPSADGWTGRLALPHTRLALGAAAAALAALLLCTLLLRRPRAAKADGYARV